MTDDKKPPFRVSFKNFMTNRLMQRKQFNIEIEHPGRSTVPKKEIQQKISQIFKIQEENTIVLFGFRTKFGGGRSTGHGMIYDNLSICKRYEPKYRLIRLGLRSKKEGSRKQKKEKKNRMKKYRGGKKAKGAVAAKKK
uniref:40S small subunit ribosomal protein eS24 n=1 Tax=Euglena gracilis TaxID=3039 RepID=A0A7L5NWP1_EUGGR|nr:40S small subunit ribosomal protein eS24 [Euglena gracilis]6ZJ3_SZ Chain SZ, Ribosomal protein eS24 [Euglena gracilis]